jgi:hypothetical protein
VTVVLLPTARRCSHVDPETGERCITYLEQRNAGPDCHVHSRRKPRSQPTDRVTRERPTPSAEAVAAGLAAMGIKVVPIKEAA